MAGPVDDIRSFLEESVRDFSGYELLDGDASARLYYRVFAEGRTYVLCRDAAFIGVPVPDYPFAVVHELIRDHVPVPEIIRRDSRRGLLLLEDLGDELLEYAFPRLDRDSIVSIYEGCIENMLSIQRIRGEGAAPFSLEFDTDKLMFEFNFFIEHALHGYFGAPTAPAELRDLSSEFLKIARILDRRDLFVLNHRDYHSRNIILHDGRSYIIDFQDARMGLPQYDAVSLLRDSYVRLDPDIFSYLKNYCYEGGRDMGVHAMGKDDFNYFFDIMAFQRNIKALGTFGYQVSARGNVRYEKYIRPTAAYLGDYAARRDELSKAWRILSAHLSAH